MAKNEKMAQNRDLSAQMSDADDLLMHCESLLEVTALAAPSIGDPEILSDAMISVKGLINLARDTVNAAARQLAGREEAQQS